MKTVVGLFDTYPHAEKAASALENAGISRNDISLVASNETEQYAKNPSTADGGHNMAEAAVMDAGVGAGIGGTLGLLAGASLFVIPGLGWLAGAGWLAGLLGGAALGGTIGGIVGVLTHIGVPEEDAINYNEGIRRGGVLLTVRADDSQAHRVAEILGDAGAIDIDERAAQWRQEGFLTTPNTPTASAVQSTPSPNYTPSAATAVQTAATQTTTLDGDREAVIPVIEESLQVGKREVERGRVRVYTHTIETPVTEQVTLREESVTVDRQPVNRPLTAADGDAFRDQTIEVTKHGEEAMVTKQARVVEEVTVGKEATQHTETISDTVRRTDVEVESIPGQTTQTTGYTSQTQLGNGLPGIQTGGRNNDGSPDTRGITEKVADAVTGDRVDDKTGKAV